MHGCAWRAVAEWGWEGRVGEKLIRTRAFRVASHAAPAYGRGSASSRDSTWAGSGGGGGGASARSSGGFVQAVRPARTVRFASVVRSPVPDSAAVDAGTDGRTAAISPEGATKCSPNSVSEGVTL